VQNILYCTSPDTKRTPLFLKRTEDRIIIRRIGTFPERIEGRETDAEFEDAGHYPSSSVINIRNLEANDGATRLLLPLTQPYSFNTIACQEQTTLDRHLISKLSPTRRETRVVID
jgi:hypothetical protein